MTEIRILLVDDEPDIREVVDVSLGLDPQFKTRACASGADALIIAADWTPSIILLDVMMPFMDGPTTLANLRKNPRTAHIPVRVSDRPYAGRRNRAIHLAWRPRRVVQAIRSDDARRLGAQLPATAGGPAYPVMHTINCTRFQAAAAQIASRSMDNRVRRSSRNNQNNKDPAPHRYNHARPPCRFQR